MNLLDADLFPINSGCLKISRQAEHSMFAQVVGRKADDDTRQEEPQSLLWNQNDKDSVIWILWWTWRQFMCKMNLSFVGQKVMLIDEEMSRWLGRCKALSSEGARFWSRERTQFLPNWAGYFGHCDLIQMANTTFGAESFFCLMCTCNISAMRAKSHEANSTI
jgi:hypothetical protein